MKKHIFSIIAFVAFAAVINAQTTNYPTDTVDGRPVYRYTVQKSEGLYRICKNFNVSQEEVIRLNPVLQSEGLKLGQKLLIPVVERIDSARYITHQLQPKETLFSISRKYGVSVPTLQELNPETSKRMAIGSTLLVKEKPSTDIIAQSISNAGEVMTSDHPQRAEDTSNSSQELPAVSEPLSLDDQLTQDVAPVDMSNAIRLAYLLPFNTSSNKRDASMDRFVDFYEGSLLAIYEAQEQGLTFDIVTFDIPKNSRTLPATLLHHDLLKTDALIGPAYPAQIQPVAQFAQQNHTHVLIPFASKVYGIENNPFLMQFNPTVEQEMLAIVNDLEQKKDKVQFVFIDTKGSERTETVKVLQEKLTQHDFVTTHSSINEVLADSLFLALDKEKENILVFNTDKYSAIQVVMSKLTDCKRNYRLCLLGRYSWSEEKCPVTMLYASVFQGNNSSAMAKYNLLRERYFNHELSALRPRYDLLGYDLTKCLINNILQAKSSETTGNTPFSFDQPYSGLQSNIVFERADEIGGWMNTQISVIRK